MSFSCGFYNAINHDRTYSATQFGEMFDGLITDGVYSTIGECFMTVPGSGLGVVVKSGRAWFNKTWSVNTTDLPLDLGMADLLLPRIDMVILEVDTRVAVRNNAIKVITGTPAVEPVRPSLTMSDGLYQYPLAYISVKANASQIEKTDITVVVGQSPCPFVTGILESVPIDDMYQQWEGQFEEWFENLKQILEGDVVGNLLYQLGNKVDKADKATVQDALAGTDDSKWMTPLVVLQEFIAQVAQDSDVTNFLDITKFVKPSQLKFLDIKATNLMNRYIVLRSITFTSSQSWRSPADLGIGMAFVFLQGGGGGGGGGYSTTSGKSGGGGAPGTIGFGITSITKETSYTITIGSGGAAGGIGKTGANGASTSAFGMTVAGGSYGYAGTVSYMGGYGTGSYSSSGTLLSFGYYGSYYRASSSGVSLSDISVGVAQLLYSSLMPPNGGTGGVAGSAGTNGSSGRVILYYFTYSG